MKFRWGALEGRAKPPPQEIQGVCGGGATRVEVTLPDYAAKSFFSRLSPSIPAVGVHLGLWDSRSLGI